jgi:hypothetical protein
MEQLRQPNMQISSQVAITHITTPWEEAFNNASR